MEMDGKIDVDAPDFYDILNKELDDLTELMKAKKEQIMSIETKAAMLLVEMSSMVNTIKTQNLDDLKIKSEEGAENITGEQK